MPRSAHPVYRNTALAYRQFSSDYFSRQGSALKARAVAGALAILSMLGRIASRVALRARRYL